MSRTKKDRPYKVKLNDLRAKAKTRKIKRVHGYDSDPIVATYADSGLSKVFLKGDVEGINQHRELIADASAKVVETEYKVPVVELICKDDVQHQHNGELYRMDARLSGIYLIKNDLFPLFSRIENTHPNCCYPHKELTRAVVEFRVHRIVTPSISVYESEWADGHLLSWSTPSKSRRKSSKRRAKERAVLDDLSRSNNVSEDWAAGTNLDDPDRFRSRR